MLTSSADPDNSTFLIRRLQFKIVYIFDIGKQISSIRAAKTRTISALDEIVYEYKSTEAREVIIQNSKI